MANDIHVQVHDIVLIIFVLKLFFTVELLFFIFISAANKKKIGIYFIWNLDGRKRSKIISKAEEVIRLLLYI